MRGAKCLLIDFCFVSDGDGESFMFGAGEEMVFERCEERAEGSVLWISNFQEYQQFGISKPLSFTSTI